MQNPGSVAETPASTAEDKIWQNPDLDPNTISILCTLAANVKSIKDFQHSLTSIQGDLNCSITMHGGSNSQSLIWLRIKHVSEEIRQRAKDQIDQLTFQPCDQIFLPSPEDNETFERRKANEPSPLSKKFRPKQQTSLDNLDEDFDGTRKAESSKGRNLTVTFAPSQNSSSNKSSKLKQISPPSSMSSSSSSSSISSSVFLSSTSSSSSTASNSNLNGNKHLTNGKQNLQHATQPFHKKDLAKHKSAFNQPPSKLVRSTTENFISFLANELNSNNNNNESSEAWSTAVSSPFGSILSPYNPSLISGRLRFAMQHDEEMFNANANRNQDSSSAPREASHQEQVIKNKRYPVDVLLMRSNVPSSKKMPDEWFDLNQKHPEVCFCGKVLSYFNPNKYHEHWEKTKLRNPDIHCVGSDTSPLEAQLSGIDLHANHQPARNRLDATKSRANLMDRRLFKTDDPVTARADGATSSRKYAPLYRQSKFAAAVNSLNEAHNSNEAVFRRPRHFDMSHNMAREEAHFESFQNGAAAYHQVNNFGGTRGSRHIQSQRFVNR